MIFHELRYLNNICCYKTLKVDEQINDISIISIRSLVRIMCVVYTLPNPAILR